MQTLLDTLKLETVPLSADHARKAHTIIYELVQAGAPIGEKMVVDISTGQNWGGYRADNDSDHEFGQRLKYPHRYPDSHPQSKSHPQESWCYPFAALDAYRQWLQDAYIVGEKFLTCLKDKASKMELASSIAQLAIVTVVPPQIALYCCDNLDVLR